MRHILSIAPGAISINRTPYRDEARARKLADLPLPPNVRRYYPPGTRHGGDDEGGFVQIPAAIASCVFPKNPNPQKQQMAAFAQALIEQANASAMFDAADASLEAAAVAKHQCGD
jgi:hypothetical protein